jgi:hypothetical protein
LISREVADSLRRMRSGTHAILVYDTPKRKREVLFSHLDFGGDREQLVYVCAEESPEKVRGALADFGMEVPRLEKEDLLAVKNYDQVYIVNDKVDIEGIIRNFADLAWGATKRGLLGMRAAAEMSCFFHDGRVEELERYEHALHRRFSFPGKGLCGYNLIELANSGRLDTLMPMLRAHDLVIMTGPKGSAVLEPDSVKERDVEAVMQVVVVGASVWPAQVTLQAASR